MVHARLYDKFPITMAVAGWLLRALYGVAVSPAFAVIVALLLVGLVISGVASVIVSLSVLGAWLIAILSIAKNEQVNKLRIAERVLVVFGLAAIMAVIANRYVKWCLLNYAKNQPVQQQTNPDNLAYDRFKELLEAMVPKYVPLPPVAQPHQTAKAKVPVKQALADLNLDFAGIDQLMIRLVDIAPTAAEKPKHWFAMVDATNMFAWPNGKPDDYQPLPLQTQTFDRDYVRHDSPLGPYDILSESPNHIAKDHVQKGDILLGMIGVTCINREYTKKYFVYFQVGSGGWFYQEPTGKDPNIPMPQKKETSIATIEDFVDKEVPPRLRTTIKKSF